MACGPMAVGHTTSPSDSCIALGAFKAQLIWRTYLSNSPVGERG